VKKLGGKIPNSKMNAQKSQNLGTSGPTPVARGGSAPPLTPRPKPAGWGGSFLMVYRNKKQPETTNAGRLGAGFISVCLETRWLGHFGGFYVPEPCYSSKDWRRTRNLFACCWHIACNANLDIGFRIIQTGESVQHRRSTCWLEIHELTSTFAGCLLSNTDTYSFILASLHSSTAVSEVVY
jgi:hypothetical protein